MTTSHHTGPDQTQPLALRVGAELAGSFLICISIYLLSTFGIVIYGLDLALIAVGTALVYTAVTLTLGAFSGGQFNPAVTLAAMLTNKTSVLSGVLYIIAQTLGGIAAGAILKFLLPTSDSVTAKTWLTPVVNGFNEGSVSHATISQAGLSFGITLAIVVEVVASLIIVACAMRTIDVNGHSAQHHALSMGVAYGAGAAICYPITGAALNPARATGIAIFAQNQGLSAQPLQQLWVFWVAPVLAAAIVALVMIIAEMASAKKSRKTKNPDSADNTADSESTEILEASHLEASDVDATYPDAASQEQYDDSNDSANVGSDSRS